ncbi:hybrid sensor histidine kinase/response regulator [Desulfobotulus mexicanus]|uniref:histidine kinase n=1 Tax=Desulfobotulus mexicanus TaxID=2586642 RepID=A0A5Q4VIG9_9BACT|nr:PAS domain-containing sensor histidine kinase [Desulfobotulus mexicanus]TYT75960.1 PAS domain S-box protein [Desulfobotulus mexicanus]
MTLKPSYEELERKLHELEKNASEHKYAKEILNVYEKAFLGYQSLDENGRYIAVNQIWLDTLGYTIEEVIGKSFTDFLHPDWRANFTENFSRFKSMGEVLGAEFKLIKKNGEYIQVSLTGNILRDEKGNFLQTHCIFHDITQHRLAEDALREKSLFLHNIIDSISDLVAVTDMEGNYLFIGSSNRILGYEPDFLIGKNIMELVHPHDHQKIATAFKSFLVNREDGRIVKYRYRKSDGEYIWLETMGKFILDDSGNPKNILFTSRDFTARKIAEEELKRIEWMLSRKPLLNICGQMEINDQGYGDLTELNNNGIILKSIGHERLKSFTNDYLELLGTSSAVYELNGDYAFGIFASGWCRMMDMASRRLCNTTDNVEALNSGQWLCHESCWTNCSKEVIARRNPVDIECNGGIRLYAVPVFAGGNVIGVINFGYGDPPKDPEKLKVLADLYHLNHKDLLYEAMAYDSRPPYIIEMAKNRLKSTAKLIGSMVETKQAMEALRDSEEKHRRLFETMAQGVIYQAADGTIISANPAAERILGLSFKQMQGKTSTDQRWKMINADGIDIDDTKHPTIIALSTGETVGPVIRGIFLPEKNSYVWLSITAIPLFEKGETKPFQAYATFEDITERKQAEEEIAKRELTLNKIFDVLPIGLWFADKNGKLLRGNPAGIKIWGAEPTVPIEKYGVFKARRLPSGEEILPEDWALAHTIKKGSTIKDELLEIDAFDGQKKIILNYTAPVVNDRGEMLGAVIVNNDITDHKRAEEQREKLQAELNQAQKIESVGRLAGGVAHDFNNMLGVILGHTELALMRADEKHDLYDNLIEIEKAAKRSADITKQLLAFARKEIISPQKLDLNDTVEKMLNMLRRLIGEDIDLTWKSASHLLPVKMDPSQIDQLLVNLCINARDAIAGVGKLTIETGIQTFDKEYCKGHFGFIPGDFVMLAVSDNGCGMDKKTLENLFEPFFTTKEVGQGTGLGLATVYGIVKQNSGFINVYSEPGQGSTFRIYLPKHDEYESVISSETEKQKTVGGSETILLVEDEPMILDMTKNMLQLVGYTVLASSLPSEAIKMAKGFTGTIHLLISDVVMPEMNGAELSSQIREICPDIHLLFMSGYTANVISHHGVLDEGVEFIQKPFTITDLTMKIRKILSS